jgi:FtsP/CotA-like multicopper oxidase with cupredoxin domain
VPVPQRGGVSDDWSKEDTVALGPNEEVVIYRNFRTFHGKYVAHCHNLAHEDHSMMFAWEILPGTPPKSTTNE